MHTQVSFTIYRQVHIRQHSGRLYTVKVPEQFPEDQKRTFVGTFNKKNWMCQHKHCLYAGSNQAGKSHELFWYGFDSVTPGTIEDHIVPGPFSEDGYKFGLFDSSRCALVTLWTACIAINTIGT